MYPSPLLWGEERGARPREPGTFLTRENLQQQNEHHPFPLCNRAKGRQEGKSPLHERDVKDGVEVNPDDVPAVVFLSRQNLGNKVVPVKEPLATEDVQNLEDRGVIAG